MKSKLQRIEEKRKSDKSLLDEKIDKSRKLRKSGVEKVANDERPVREASSGKPTDCLFCHRVKWKDKKIEPLRRSTDDEVRKKIAEKAKVRGDFRMIGIITQIGPKGFYHHSCHSRYMTSTIVDETSQAYKNVESKAVESIIKFCHSLTKLPELLPFTTLSQKAEEVFREERVVFNPNTKKGFRPTSQEGKII